MPYVSTIFRNNRRYLTGLPLTMLYDVGWREGQTLIWRVYRDGRAVVRPASKKGKEGNRARPKTSRRT